MFSPLLHEVLMPQVAGRPSSLEDVLAAAPTSFATSALSVGRFLAAYGFLPNVAFALAGQWLYLMRPTFNLDYLLLGALRGWLGRRVSAVLLTLTVANDLLINASPAFHFALPDFLRSLRHLDAVEPKAIALGALALLAVSAGVAWAMVRLGGDTAWPRMAVGAMVLLAGLDIANGTSFLPVPGARSFLSINVANSGVRKTLLALRTLATASPARPTPPLTMQGASAALLARARDPSQPLPRRNQVLVVVESMGLFRDAATASLLVGPLTQLSARYAVAVGDVPFQGATMNGELRELCGQALESAEQLPADCLPAALAKRGFETVALHGFTNQFYDRASWYPKVGFERALFAEDLRAAGLDRSCGSGFRGLCDADVGERLHQELLASRDGPPRFAYWMTLNSHLPEIAAVGEGAPFDCTAGELTENGALCLHARALSAALATVARIAADPQLPPTDFIVVGDHAPPFWGRTERDAFDDARVPSVTLTWRD